MRCASCGEAFSPKGLAIHEGMKHTPPRITRREATLRAALDGLVEACDALVAAESRYMDPNDLDNTADGLVVAEAKFRAALAKAKGTP